MGMKHHWKIFKDLSEEFTKEVGEFMVIGQDGDGVLMITCKDGEGFWYGKLKFGWEIWRETTEPTSLGVSGLASMAHGSNHIVLLDKQGQCYSMGQNEKGQLGLGTVNNETYFTPQLISSSHRFISIRCGQYHTVALTDDGKVYGWGCNANKQLAMCDSGDYPTPQQISQLDPYRVVAIACGGRHSLALTDTGKVFTWGDNREGQLGRQSNHFTPTQLTRPQRPVIQIAAGIRHTLLLTDEGQVFACGSNWFGELALPIHISSSFMVQKISGLPRISQISSHFENSLSIALSTEQPKCWVWGRWKDADIERPLKLEPNYSTIESIFSLGSDRKNTSHSVPMQVKPAP